MAKQLNINLAFKADTTQARQQLQQLQTQLNNLTTSSISQQLPITPKLQEAQNAAINLKIALQQSMNVDTGKFDLTKFNNSLKRAGTSLNQMRIDLSKFGPEGQQAFMTLAQSIMQAEVPMRRTNALLAQLGTTLKNTAKWQISSMALHGFMSAISGAYGYAQDLNESLNNIRIVTNKNIDDMKKFADQANKAAKALSTTTTAYTDASLIYYQQGLSDAEVLKRADVTVKMANATGQAAEVVSDQMTAIWNNFYDGSKALEYYSDVVTALGAATASSSDEIAEGLEKFAAVADTVGLSYEYATSALATVTATTRQSADVVGTAFKTLFARIQDLELGKTLDDGTTLGAYAESLQAVGINIKESNGELKQMDDILNEMGSVWKTLSNDQQAALAQSVAGVRQYTQLMALMENWDYFKDNLQVAKDATGTLQEQADIYAESWEAAQKRVQASAQAIYQDLISDEFFIDLQNNFADFLDTIDKAIDGMGGLKGVVALLGGVLLTAFSGQAARGLENMAYNIKMMTAWGSQEIMQTKELAYQEAMRVSNSGYITATQEAQVKVMQNQLLLQNDLIKKANNISEEEKQRCQAIINENKLYGEQYIELTKIKEQIGDTRSKQVQETKLLAMSQNKAKGLPPDLTTAQKLSFGQAQEQITAAAMAQGKINQLYASFGENGQNFDNTKLKEYKASIDEIINSLSNLKGIDISQIEQQLKRALNRQTPDEFKQAIHEMAMDSELSTQAMATGLDHLRTVLGLDNSQLLDLINTMQQFGEAEFKTKNANDLFADSVTRSQQAIENAKAAMSTWADSLVRIAGGVSSLVFAMQSLSSIGDVFNNEDMTAGEKFLQITMSLSMAIPMLVNGLKSLRLVKLKDLATTTMSTVVKIANATATKAQAKAEAQHATATNLSTKEKIKNTAAEVANKFSKGAKGIKNIPKNFVNNWNQQSLENNPNFTKTQSGSYAVKGQKGFVSADKAASMAGKQALSGLGSMIGTLGLVAAGIAVAAASITIASNIYNKDVKAAKKATEDALAATEAYNSAKQAYESLKSTVSDYNESVDSISKMTKGTLEFKEAVQQANEKALELIDTYGILDYTINKETGLIEINESALQQAQAEAFSDQSRAQRAAIGADRRASEAQMKADTTKFNREYASHMGVSDEDWAIIGGAAGGGAGTGAAIGAIVGTVAGSIVPVIGNLAGNAAGALIGTAIGAGVGLIGGTIGALADNDSEEQEEDAIDKLVKIYGEKGNAMFADSEFEAILDSIGASESLKESLIANKEETKKLIAELHANTEANKLKKQQEIASYLETSLTGGLKSTYENSSHKDQLANMAANSDIYDETYKSTMDRLNDAWDWLPGGKENISDKDLHKAYSDLMGWDSTTTKIKNKSGKAEFTFEDGSTKTISDEAMRHFIASEKARQAAAAQIIEYEKSINKTEEWGKNIAEKAGLIGEEAAEVGEFLASGSIATATQEQVDALKAGLKEVDPNDIVSDEQAQAAGYATAEQYIAAIQEQLDEYDPEIAAEKRAAEEQKEFDQILAEGAQSTGVSSQALEAYAQSLMTTNKELQENKKAAAECAIANARFAKGVDSLKDSLNKNAKILEIWNENAIETYEAVAEVQTALKDVFGVEVSADFVKKNFKEIQALANGDTSALEQLRQAAAKDYVLNLGLEEGATNTINSLLDEVINQDRNIAIGTSVDLGNSVEEINKLLEAGVLTADQITAAFNAIGYEPNIKWKNVPNPNPSVTETTSYVEIGGFQVAKVTSSSISDSTISVPYITSEETGSSDGSTVSGASVTKTTSSSALASGLSTKATGAETSAEKKKRFKDLDDEIERYHEIDEVIQDLERDFDALSKAKDSVYGANKLYLMDQEIAKNKELLEATKSRLEEAKKWYEIDRQNLLSNYAVELDSSGRITNYNDLIRKETDKLKKMQNPESDEYKLQEERLNDMKEAFTQYEESLDAVNDEQQNVIDKQRELQEQALEKINYEVQFKIEASEDDLERLDFLIERLDDDAFAAADKIGLLGQKAGSLIEQFNALNDSEEGGIAKIIKAYEAGEISSQQAVDQLREYKSNLADVVSELYAVRNTVQEELSGSIEAWNGEIEKGINKLGFYTSMLEGYKNVIDIIGKDAYGLSNDTINKLNDAIVTNSTNIIKSTKAQLEANKATRENMIQARNEALAREDNEAVKEWDKQIEAMDETIQDLELSLQDALTTGLEAAANAFKDTVNQIADSFSDAVSGIYDSIEQMSEAWDRQQEIGERYLKTYEKTYEINKLNRQIQDSMDKTDNIASQKQLRALQQEMLDMSKDGQEMSKYDLEYLQKKYDLLVAEQAFKDAQNAKSVVRLQRDSEGNFGYVYTADEGATENARQNYEDKLFAYQDFSHKMDEELTSQYISAAQKQEEALRAAAEKYGVHSEEFARISAQINREFEEDVKYITDEYSKLTDRNIEINQRFSAGVASTYSRTFLGQIQPNYNSFQSLFSGTTKLCEQATIDLGKALVILQDTFDKQLEAAGIDAEDLEDVVNEKFEDVRDDSDDTADAVKNMAKDMNDALNDPQNGVIKKVKDFQEAYSGEMARIYEETETTMIKVNELLTKLGLINGAEIETQLPESNDNKTPTKGSDTTPEPPAAPDPHNYKSFSKIQQINGEYYGMERDDNTGEYKFYRINQQDKNNKLVQGEKTYDITKDKDVDKYEYDIGEQTGYSLREVLGEPTVPGIDIKELKEGMTFSTAEIQGTIPSYGSKSSSPQNSPSAWSELTFDQSADSFNFKIDGFTTEGKWSYVKLRPLNDIGEFYNSSDGLDSKASTAWVPLGFGGRLKAPWVGLDEFLSLLNASNPNKQYKKPQGYDTGGYTGAWGPEGRLAMLHQKEIVLNAHDTENFLAAIGIVRDISDQIEKNALVMQYQNQLANYRASVGNSGDTLQQEVHITAEFPNATNHSEIEEAFRNLTNLASQYANRKF